ncbi:MAG TPA: hypothetical protein VHA12_02100 [Candidatus Nanoarchaeia archaeon]|nr:hypothetical protein [Candidatus Nanoarchaeia archaeon]
MHKAIGYVSSFLGLVGIAASTFGSASLQTAIGLGPENKVADTTVLIAGIILVALGVFFIAKGASNKVSEVPIYNGKDIVGYRRVKN